MKLYTSRETAEILRCSEKTLYNRVKDGLIQPMRNGRRILFDDDRIKAYLENESPNARAAWVNACEIPGETPE